MTAMPVCYLDLDLTLYNTELLITDVESYLRSIGHDDTKIRPTMDAAIQRGYTFESHLRLLEQPDQRIPRHAGVLGDLLDHGDRYLLSGVGDGLRALSASIDCALLTFGNPTFQARKFRGVRAFYDVFTSQHYVWNRDTKGDVIRDRGPRRDVWYLEDSPGQLEDVLLKAPWVRCVRMRSREVKTDSHPGDRERWMVVESFSEFVHLVLNPV